MIGIDTLSWSKLYLIREELKKLNIDELLDEIRFFITPDVREELEHFHSDKDRIWENGAILPQLNRSFQGYVKQGFDFADASLLEYSELKDYLIVTEDYPMLALNVSGKNNIIQLADLFTFFYLQNMITTSNYRDTINWLRRNRNITKKKFKRLTK